MVALNYHGDIEEISEEARYLADNGVVILKCYRGIKGIFLKVSTRIDFEEACHLCEWYASERNLGKIVNIDIGDFVRKGDLQFLIIGGAL